MQNIDPTIFPTLIHEVKSATLDVIPSITFSFARNQAVISLRIFISKSLEAIISSFYYVRLLLLWILLQNWDCLISFIFQREHMTFGNIEEVLLLLRPAVVNENKIWRATQGFSLFYSAWLHVAIFTLVLKWLTYVIARFLILGLKSLFMIHAFFNDMLILFWFSFPLIKNWDARMPWRHRFSRQAPLHPPGLSGTPNIFSGPTQLTHSDQRHSAMRCNELLLS